MGVTHNHHHQAERLARRTFDVNMREARNLVGEFGDCNMELEMRDQAVHQRETELAREVERLRKREDEQAAVRAREVSRLQDLESLPGLNVLVNHQRQREEEGKKPTSDPTLRKYLRNGPVMAQNNFKLGWIKRQRNALLAKVKELQNKCKRL